MMHATPLMQKLIVSLWLTYLSLSLELQSSEYILNIQYWALVSLFCWFLFCRSQQSILQLSVAHLKSGSFANMNSVNFMDWIGQSVLHVLSGSIPVMLMVTWNCIVTSHQEGRLWNLLQLQLYISPVFCVLIPVAAKSINLRKHLI